MNLPYFIQDLPGIGGVLKERPEDFVVHEIPRYEPCGDGEHVMAEIEKTGLSTPDAIDLLSRRLKVPRRDIGYAGLKDTNAVTRQWVTLRGTTPDAVFDAAGDKLKVLFADRHRNKLRLGHLAGNRFAVKVRQVDPMKVVTLTPALHTLAERGMPNYFGPQRFGRAGRNAELGAALLRQDFGAVLGLLIGTSRPGDDPAEADARAAYDAGDLGRSQSLWPRHGRDERDALARLLNGDAPARVVGRVGRHVRSLWLSAAQSLGFNAVVAARIDAIDDLLDGDLAYKHENGATFRVESADAERERAKRFDVSATGPLFGPAMQTPTAAAAAVETAALASAGIAVDNDAPADRLADAPPGGRRPLRVRPSGLRAEAGIDAHGPYIHFDFELPAGAYATVLLRELMRNAPEGRDPVPSPGTPGEG